MSKYWFKHDHGARNDPKIQRVFMKLGHEGKSIFWDLIEMLYEQGGTLPLSECESYAFTLRTTLETLKSLINDFDLFRNDGQVFWNDRTISRIKEFSDKSSKATKSVEARWERQRQKQSDIRSYNDRITNVSQNDTIVIQEYRIENIDKEINNNPLPPNGEVCDSSSLSTGNEEFEVFWGAYGKKVDRSKCERKFKNLGKAERDAIKAHVPKYVASTPNERYRKNPLTYLNGKCWQDEDLPPGEAGVIPNGINPAVIVNSKHEMVY